MQILVTGAHGKVGAATIHELIAAGHEVTGCDVVAPVYEGGDFGAHYVQADLTDAGDAFAVVRGADVVIHCAALPEPTRNVGSTVFRNNVMATFNVAEAAVRMGVDRVVNVSSETVTGMAFAERPFHAAAAPIDESVPARPQDPYALAKVFGEQLMDAMVARSDVTAVSIRPSWVQWEGNYERSLKPWVSDPFSAPPSESFWSYIDIYDLAHGLRLAAEARTAGHEALYVVSADNGTGRPLRELIAHHFGEAVAVGELARADAGGISYAKAERLIGYKPAHTWRDYLNEDGLLLDAPRERLARGETGVQRGRAALG
ncbi:NAD(P)-dependent oxidoreductase [Solirubrobacter sp. CPCC 204708]|uniref:NAD(P)-dependent oxidoreductase n=1 Tax=Solirubrobacter deserti TaxID=2282478 RepID=A0ABT4RNJ9_9ACTN|nr:NAD(P)-dependent oxidoreductase [Solirubrobacter deserti]MBE2314906.1 NAD(P)-dependent oxidoreductase [Solirubrobacter deserti]MDA0140134.1 NAD(P)-dependent oxidoreductase [Solirubrobacter deserti]